MTASYEEGSPLGDELLRFTELRVLVSISRPMRRDFNASFPRLIGVHFGRSDADVLEVPGLTEMAIGELEGPGLAAEMPSAATLRALTISPTYSQDGEDGWHARTDVGVLRLINAASNLVLLHWSGSYPIEIERTFVGRPDGRLRTLRLLGICTPPIDYGASSEAIIGALPPSLVALAMTFAADEESDGSVRGLGSRLLNRLEEGRSLLPALAALQIGPCGDFGPDEDGELPLRPVATEARAREVAALRGLELELS